MQMLSSNYPHITDEMLSAYIDAQLPEDEYNLVEAAIAADDKIAWRVNALRQTIAYLNELPELAPPRSFALPASMGKPIGKTSESATAATAVADSPQRRVLHPARDSQPGGFWAGVREFWQGGNPVLRNAMAVSMALVLLLIGAGIFYSDPLRENFARLTSIDNPAPVAIIDSEPAADEAAAESAIEESLAESIESDSDTESSDVNTEIVNTAGNNTVADAAADSADSQTATGAIMESTPTAVSVAMAPTATEPSATEPSVTEPAPTATPETVTLVPEPTTAEFVNPSVTPSKPLAVPTQVPTRLIPTRLIPTQLIQTPLPTPDIPLAQAPASNARTTTMSAASSAAGAAGPAGSQMEQAGSILADEEIFEAAAASIEEASEAAVYAESTSDTAANESSSIASMSSRRTELPTIAAQSATITQAETSAEDSSSADVPESAESNMMAAEMMATETNIDDEAGTGNEANATAASAAPATKSVSTSSAPENLESENSEADEASLDLLPLVFEVDNTTGALTGQLWASGTDGEFKPITGMLIYLIEQLPDGTVEEQRVDELPTDLQTATTDNQGFFAFFEIVPGKYGLQQNGVLLTQPEQQNETLIVEIKAGEQNDLGNLEYQSLP